MCQESWSNLFKSIFQKKNIYRNKQITKEQLIELLDRDKIPQHIAIIMDGNGRWAQERGLPRVAGHRAGVETIRSIVKIAQEVGVKALTLYAFSTENWKRSSQEVNALMKLLQEFLRRETQELHRKNVKITAIGQLDKLPDFAYEELGNSIKLTENNEKLTLNLALNYGGRAEIVGAVSKIATDVQQGKITLDEIDDQLFANYLYTRDLPELELLIRTSGELRLSNFLLWQVAYTEFWTTPIYWPQFSETNLLEAILAYQKRDRRYGGVNL